MCTEELPRQERAAESYMKQSAHLDSKVMSAWSKWDESRKNLKIICDQALSDCPELADFVEKINLQSELRQIRARDDMRHKLLSIENEEIDAFTEYMSDMPNMMKKLYLTLKGYDKAPPALREEYMEIVRKAKSAKGTCSVKYTMSTHTHNYTQAYTHTQAHTHPFIHIRTYTYAHVLGK